MIKRNRKHTRERLRDECAPDVSLATIDQYLRKNGVMKWLAKRQPKLTPERVAKRLKWAKGRKTGWQRTLRGLFGAMNA